MSENGFGLTATEEQVAEARELLDEILFQVWLVKIDGQGHEAALYWALEYGKLLKGEPSAYDC